jgi:hypothetical protein
VQLTNNHSKEPAMIKFAPPLTTIQLALAAAVLIPISVAAETPMTARQMLAHAQTQALNVPGDIRKPALEPDRGDKISSGSVGAPTSSVAIAAPLPMIEPPARIAPAATTISALASPAAVQEGAALQSRANSLTAVPPPAGTVSVSNALVTPPSMAAAIAETQPAAPATPPVSAVASSAAAPAVVPAAAPAQPPLPATAATETTRVPPVATTSSSDKPAHAQRQPMTDNSAPARPARKTAARSSTRSDDAAIGTRISRIMRRPEVQSLMSQYGLD